MVSRAIDFNYWREKITFMQQGLVVWKSKNKKWILIWFLYFDHTEYYYEAQLQKGRISS